MNTNEKIVKIIKQIQNLLALSASSPFPEESASALEKARLLIEKYHIDEAQLNNQTSSIDDIIEIDFMVASSALNYTIKFSYWLSEAFNCKNIMVKRNIGTDQIKFESSIRFIGKQSDISICSFVYCYMCSILENKATDYAKQNKGKRIKHDFSLGFVENVCNRLKILKQENDAKLTPSESEQLNALVVSTKALINNYIDKKYGDDKFESGGNKIEFNPNAYHDGYKEGEKYGFFRGIGETKNHKKECIK